MYFEHTRCPTPYCLFLFVKVHACVCPILVRVECKCACENVCGTSDVCWRECDKCSAFQSVCAHARTCACVRGMRVDER